MRYDPKKMSHRGIEKSNKLYHFIYYFKQNHTQIKNNDNDNDEKKNELQKCAFKSSKAQHSSACINRWKSTST